MIRWITAACLILTCSTVVRAQTAGISGTVVDETGSGVPGAVKVTNLFNQDIQQHVFGDILKRTVSFEVRIRS
jgi:hypothetical protein